MENTLNIQIKVTDEQMTSLLKGKLESLPDEKVQEIFAGALSEFFKTDDGKKLFCIQDYWNSNPKPTPLLVHMVENAVSKELLKPCVDEFVGILKDNYTNLIRDTMIQTFSNMFITEMRESNLKLQLNMLTAKVDGKEDKR